MRVAAAQCETGTDVDANIATLVRMAAEAAAQGAKLVVLPEFGNHLSIYDSAEHAWDVAIDLDDESDAFVKALATCAAEHGIWVVANSTVRRAPAIGDAPARITVTQLLFSPTAGLVADADKQVLMGAERTFLVGGDTPSTVVDTPLGRIGLYCCMDGVINEAARSLAVQGAEIMCNSLNSFALDEASLHVPARAAENKVWVVACCKVGPLIPEDRRAEFAAFVQLPESTFTGAGESQVVAPDGSVVAMGPHAGEAVVIADIDVSRAADKSRPDGTDVFGLRRPELYGPVAQDVPALPPSGAESVQVAAVQAGCGDVAALAAEVRRLASDGVDLIVLPELSALPDGLVEDVASAVAASAELVGAVTDALSGTDAHAVVSVVEADHADGADGPGSGAVVHAHIGLVLSAAGEQSRQPALHRPDRHAAWQGVLGDRVKVLATPFGRLAVLVGDDVFVPEAGRLAALGGAEVVASPTAVAEAADLPLALAERCAENRMCVVAASRPGSHGASAAYDPPADPVWSRPPRVEEFDGAINDPDRHLAGTGDAFLRAVLHPVRAAEKLISTDTDLLHGRRPELQVALTR